MFCWRAEGYNEGAPTVLRTGATVLALHGDFTMELLVAQGCRPLGDSTYTVQRVDRGNIVRAISTGSGEGAPAISPLAALQRDVLEAASSKAEM